MGMQNEGERSGRQMIAEERATLDIASLSIKDPFGWETERKQFPSVIVYKQIIPVQIVFFPP